MSKITNIFFSPSGTTKKVLNQIASNFDEENQICDLLYFNDAKEFGAADVVIVGMPVFAGRLPKTGSHPDQGGNGRAESPASRRPERVCGAYPARGAAGRGRKGRNPGTDAFQRDAPVFVAG